MVFAPSSRQEPVGACCARLDGILQDSRRVDRRVGCAHPTGIQSGMCSFSLPLHPFIRSPFVFHPSSILRANSRPSGRSRPVSTRPLWIKWAHLRARRSTSPFINSSMPLQPSQRRRAVCSTFPCSPVSCPSLLRANPLPTTTQQPSSPAVSPPPRPPCARLHHGKRASQCPPARTSCSHQAASATAARARPRECHRGSSRIWTDWISTGDSVRRCFHRIKPVVCLFQIVFL